MNLNKLIELVKKSNPSVVAARLSALASGNEANIGFSKFLPSVVATAEYNKNFNKNLGREVDGNKIEYGDNNYGSSTKNASISADYNLFNSGRDFFSLRTHKYAAKAYEYEESNVTQESILNSVRLYHYIILLEEQKKAKLEEENARAELRLIAASKQKLGSFGPGDKLKAESSYLEAKMATAELDRVIKEKRMELNHHLDLRSDQNLFLENPTGGGLKIGVADVENRIKDAIESDPQLKKFLEEKKQVEDSLRLAKLDMLPIVTAGVRAGASMEDDRYSGEILLKQNQEHVKRTETMVGLNAKVNFPIFSGFSGVNRLRAQQRHLESYSVKIESRKRAIQDNVVNIINNIKYYKDMIPSLEKSLRLQTEIFDGVLVSYKNGGSSMTDVLLARSSLERVKTELLKEKYNLLVSKLELLKQIGKLSTENIINLGGFL
ncbi:MAG: TolC family protein [Rickettsiales bacterium]|nr:TolC family protein [Rickettsiales bacterium]